MAHQSRRTPAQWQAIIEQWQQSGQTGTHFCKDNTIGYASFCKWRKRLSDEQVQISPNITPQFIDLAALQAGTGHWHIVLSLGNGVELKLSQG
ncbi:MAG: IS66 family insertion sequence element accessory protein TnpB [Gammaproteobacteria bacterium]